MQSMDEIYQKYARTVYKYLLSLVHNSDVAEELTQETFYQAVKSIERYDGSCAVSTWLCAIAKNQLFTYQRKHPIQESLDDDLRNLPPSKSNDDSARSAESVFLDSLDKVELLRRLHQCPEPFREILYLRIFGNLSFKEIGQIMGQTENWARVTFYRGKGKLRKELSENED